MNFKLVPVCEDDIIPYIKDMQEAFQLGGTNEFSNLNVEILPQDDIMKSLSAKGSLAYKAVVDDEMVGGAILVIDEATQHNHLDFLYVKNGIQSKGIGLKIWNAIEKLHPDTKVRETVTPYFEKRNIHFYINRCGFAAVEFFNPHHKDLTIPDDMIGGDYFFRFEKVMK